MKHSTYYRSPFFEKIVSDELKFREIGVTQVMTNSTRSEYRYIHAMIHDELSPKNFLGSLAMQEIAENKWFLHMYSILGTLN